MAMGPWPARGLLALALALVAARAARFTGRPAAAVGAPGGFCAEAAKWRRRGARRSLAVLLAGAVARGGPSMAQVPEHVASEAVRMSPGASPLPCADEGLPGAERPRESGDIERMLDVPTLGVFNGEEYNGDFDLDADFDLGDAPGGLTSEERSEEADDDDDVDDDDGGGDDDDDDDDLELSYTFDSPTVEHWSLEVRDLWIGAAAEMDLNEDGIVDQDEYRRSAMSEMGCSADYGLGLGDEERDEWSKCCECLDRLFLASDIDQDGRLCRRELEYYARLAYDLGAWRRQKPENNKNADMWDFNGADAARLHESFDADGDLAVSMYEFARGLREIVPVVGWRRRVLDSALLLWLDEVFRRADIDGDGSLAVRELDYAGTMVEDALCSGGGILVERALLSDAFSQLDRNRNKRISRRELRRGVRRAARGNSAYGARDAFLWQEMRKGFADADVDRDGTLDWAETARLVHRIVEARRVAEEAAQGADEG